VRRLFLCLAALLSLSASPPDHPPEWDRPVAPFRVVGPIYYVGTEGIASYLIRTSQGLILLDGGLEESATLVGRNIAALDIVGDFQRTFARMGRLRADVVLPAHPELADVLGRARRGQAAFVAPDLLPRLVTQSQAAFEAALRKESGS
jgi:hypothetical protein